MNDSPKRFRLALSFPGEKRTYVERMARLLADRFGEESVLYDRFHTAEFARPNLAFYLPDLYRKESDLVVVVLCEEYESKEWCGLEWRAIFDLIKARQDQDVMLFRADEAEIRGLYSGDGYAPVDAFTPEAAVNLILQRLAINEAKPRDFYLNGAVVSPYTQVDTAISTSQYTADDESNVDRDSLGFSCQLPRTLLAPKERMFTFGLLCGGIWSLSTLGVSLGGSLAGVASPVPLLLGAYFWRDRWLPQFSSYSRIRLGTLLLIFLTSTLYFLPSTPVSAVVTDALNTLTQRLRLPPLKDPNGFTIVTSLMVLFASLTINFLMHRRQVSSARANWARRELLSDERDFHASLKRYCYALVAELDRYDRDVNWSDRELTPLEAEVETEGGARVRPRIAADLVNAIRRDRASTVFLVLGDPGSGKSVSLRRLVRVLCQQAMNTGVVPVYVNLREYPANQEPSTESIVTFVRNLAFQQTGRDGRAFLDTWYEAFRKAGRLFFVVDSFDELPAVLDSDDKSESHKRVSKSFDRFFTQEIQTCRAVIASRHFRAPVGIKATRLVVRPFNERQIRAAMRTWLLGKGLDTDDYIRRLFRERPNLVPALRNPFTAELIAEFAISGPSNRLPENMYAVFDHYLQQRLSADQVELARLRLSADQVREGAGTIAYQMYESSDFGLEVDIDSVEKSLIPFCGNQAPFLLEALRYTRLARIGGRDRHHFSFVHRRFAEFFVVDALRRNGGRIEEQSIPTDSRWRDCLVMYCGIADIDMRRRIANYCWRVIDSMKDVIGQGDLNKGRDAIHCGRFLIDAFRADPEPLADFCASLGDVAIELLGSNDLLVKKIGSEMIPLLDERSQQAVIVSSFETGSSWISDTALNACRHIGVLAASTQRAVRRYLRSLPISDILNRFTDISFSLSLSDAFRRQRRLLVVDVLEIFTLSGIGFVVTLLVFMRSPSLILMGALMMTLSSLMMEAPLSRLSTRRIWLFRNLRGSFDFWLRVWLGFFVGLLTSHYVRRTSQSILSANLSLVTSLIWIYIPTMFFLLFRWDTPLLMLEADWRSLFRSIWTKAIWTKIISILGFVVAVVVFILGLYFLADKAFQSTTIKTVMIILGGCGLLGFIGIIGRLWYWQIKDSFRRRQIFPGGFRGQITCEELYETLSEFHGLAARREYLASLRRSQVALVGAYRTPPPELSRDPTIAEGLARLREQWLGLST